MRLRSAHVEPLTPERSIVSTVEPEPAAPTSMRGGDARSQAYRAKDFSPASGSGSFASLPARAASGRAQIRHHTWQWSYGGDSIVGHSESPDRANELEPVCSPFELGSGRDAAPSSKLRDSSRSWTLRTRVGSPLGGYPLTRLAGATASGAGRSTPEVQLSVAPRRPREGHRSTTPSECNQ